MKRLPKAAPHVNKKSPCPGYVYLMEAGGRHKIGRTNNVSARLKYLNGGRFHTSIPFEIVLIHSIKVFDQRTVERWLHARFAGKRKRGEWFDLTPEDVEWVCSLMDSDFTGGIPHV